MCNSTILLHWTTVTFDWCVVRRGSNHKHIKDTCLNKVGLRFQLVLITPNKIVNTIWGTCGFNEGVNKHALVIIIIKSCRSNC